MAVSTNLGLYLPTREDYISVSRDLSNNYEIIDKSAGMLEKGIAIVVDGDTAPRVISSGQYLFIKNHSSLATGGYHATANIANGATITSSNVSADSAGVVNAAYASLSSDISALNSNLIKYGATGAHTAGPKFTIQSCRTQLFGAYAYTTVKVKADQAYGNTDVIANVPSGYRPVRNTPSLLGMLQRGTELITFTGTDNLSTNGEITEGFTSASGQANDLITMVFIYSTKD